MKRTIFLAVLIALFTFSCAGAPKQADPAVLKDLAGKYLGAADDDAREKILGQMQAAGEFTASDMRAALKSCRVFPTVKPGVYFAQLDLPAAGTQAAFTIYVPKSYNPDNSSGLILGLHGASEGSEGSHTLFEAWADNSGYLLVDPAFPVGYWWLGANEMIAGILEYMFAHFNVDTNRVCVTGFSNGGHGTYYFGLRMPHLFAAAMPMSGSTLGEVEPRPEAKFYENAFGVAFMGVHGQRDPGIPAASSKAAIDAMKALGYDADFKGYPMMGHTYPPKTDFPEFGDWFKSKVRKPFPKKMLFHADKAEFGRAYWITMNGITGLATLDAQIDENSNTITLRTENVKGLTLNLAPELVDFARPVKIVYNGKEVFNASVTESPRITLESAKNWPDMNMLFTARIEIANDNGNVVELNMPAAGEADIAPTAEEIAAGPPVERPAFEPGIMAYDEYITAYKTASTRGADVQQLKGLMQTCLTHKSASMRLLGLKIMQMIYSRQAMSQEEAETIIYAAANDKDRSTYLREFALRLIEPSNDKQLQILIEASKDADFQIRNRAIENLTQTQGDSAVMASAALFEALADSKWQNRLAAVRGLWEFKSKSTVDKMIEIAKSDPDYNVRLAAAAVANSFDAEMAKEVFETASKYPHPDVKAILETEGKGGPFAIRRAREQQTRGANSLQQMMNEAIQLLQNKKFDEAIGIYRQILEMIQPYPAEQTAQIKQNCYYNVACAYSLQNKKDDAIEALKFAVKYGWKDTNHMATDKDLDNIRQTPEYKAIIDEINAGGAEQPQEDGNKTPQEDKKPPQKEPGDDWR